MNLSLPETLQVIQICTQINKKLTTILISKFQKHLTISQYTMCMNRFQRSAQEIG